VKKTAHMESKTTTVYGKVPRRRRKARASPPYNKQGALTMSNTPGSLTTLLNEPWMPVFPPRIYKKLRYSTNISLGAASGAVSSWVFRANDLFDPDFTSTGHQPMGFDQLMNFYNHFIVAKAVIHCTFKNLASFPASVCIRQDADSTPITVIDRILEIGGCAKADLEFKGVSGSQRSLELGLDVARLQGVSRVALTSDPSLQGNAAASPAEVTYFHVQCWDSTAAGASSVGVDIILEQEAYFCEPRNSIES